jgi:hypothetical protein
MKMENKIKNKFKKDKKTIKIKWKFKKNKDKTISKTKLNFKIIITWKTTKFNNNNM